MKLKLFLATLMALWSVDSGAQVLSSELSFRPVLSSMSGYSSISGYEISHQSELGLNKSVTLYELSGSITIPQLSLSDQEISTFKHIGKLLIPEELIYLFYQPEEIEKIISDVEMKNVKNFLKF